MIAAALAVSGALWAVEMDFTGFDDDLMRTMDDAIKDLEPVIRAGNVRAASDDAAVLSEGLKWTEQYFAAKGGADDAVKFAQEGQALVASVVKSLSTKDLDAAAAGARTLAKSCRSCHDAYKPREAR